MTDTLDRLKAALAGKYTVESELGAGGMATVYLAHDVKHNRKVAIKVLKPELSAVIGGERFVQEIEVTANLQHPNILPLYDSGTATAADGEATFLYYVMPLIEGESLRDRLDRERQLPVEESVEIAKAVAAALDYAHRHEVVHRDIKPENILVHDGQALVADFGIALAVSAAGGQRMTETGMSIGTPHYMSPEQASADRELDGRTDVYSLGATLHEMLAGQPPFIGASAQAIVARILTEDPPPVTRERQAVPANVESAIAKSLAKLPADRFQTAAEFSTALSSPTFAVAGSFTGRQPEARSPWLVRAFSAAIVGLLIVALWGWLRPQHEEVFRLAVAFADGEGIRRFPNRRFAVSPDGRRIAYVGPGVDGGVRQIWVRELDKLRARPLPGTDLPHSLFFSPDGESVGFVDGQPGDLKTVSIDGGQVQIAASDSVNPWGGSWGPDGWLYFTIASGRLARARVGSGELETIAAPDSAESAVGVEYDWPEVLPNGKGVVFQIWRSSIGNASLAALSLETGEVTKLADAVYGRYHPSGYLFYLTLDGALSARPFDVDRLGFTGDPTVVESDVRVETFAGVGQFDISNTGNLVYQSGGGGASDQIVRVDRDGTGRPIDPNWRGGFETLAISPDGTKLAVTVAGANGSHIWVKELDTGPAQPLTFEGSANTRGTWNPDGRTIVFLQENQMIARVRADGGAPPQLLLGADRLAWESFWSDDGAWLVMRVGGTGTGTRDIHALRPGTDSVPRPIIASPADEYGPALSPDGHWLAYVSNETGREEVFVRPFPDADRAKIRVTVDGGSEPRWAHSGRELFLRNARGEMVVHSVDPEAAMVNIGPAEVLFDASIYQSDNFHVSYDVTQDDQQFMLIATADDSGGDVILVIDWLEEVKAKVRQTHR